MHLTGERPELPTEVDQAAYRIVQEGLTNAARHGHGAVELRVTFGEEALEIVVSNPVEETTVKTHVKRVLAKLAVRDRVQAVIVAYESGLVEVGRASASTKSSR